MWHEIPFHEVEVADRVEQARPDRRQDLVEVRRNDLRQASPRRPRCDARDVILRAGVDVDAADDEVVRMPGEVIADVGLVGAVIGDLDTEPDRDPAGRPSLGGVTGDPLAVLERGVRERGRPGYEIHVVGDRGDAALDGLGGVVVDRDVAVGRQVGVEMPVEREVERLSRRVLDQPAIRPRSRPTAAKASSA